MKTLPLLLLAALSLTAHRLPAADTAPNVVYMPAMKFGGRQGSAG